MTIRILILTPGFPTNQDKKSYGGEFLLAEAEAYAQAGAHVRVLTPHAPGLPLHEKFPNGVEIVRFRYFFPTSQQKVRDSQPIYSRSNLLWKLLQLPFFALSFLFSIGREMRHADIVHANWTPTALLALPWQRFFKIPVVLTYRGSDLRLLPKWLNRFIIKRCAAILDVWGDTGWAIENREVYPGRYIRLPLISRTPANGRLDNQGGLWPHSEKHFVFVGRLVSGTTIENLKGAKILIPAASRLHKIHDFILDIVGDGPDREFLEKQRKEYNASEFVTIHGHRHNVFPYFQNAFAVISNVGLSAVVQEAARCKKPLIMPNEASHNGKVWNHKKNAILYQPCSADALAEAMCFVLENPEESKKIAAAGYKTIKKYVKTPKEAGKEYLNAFEKIISRHR